MQITQVHVGGCSLKFSNYNQISKHNQQNHITHVQTSLLFIKLVPEISYHKQHELISLHRF